MLTPSKLHFALHFVEKAALSSMPLRIDLLILGKLKQKGFIAAIDEALPKTSNNQGLSNGELLSLLIAKLASSEPSALSHLPKYAASIPLAAVLERDDVDPTMFNRYAVGALLDRIAEYGPARIMALCSQHTISEEDLLSATIAHLDSTSYHIHGAPLAWNPLEDPATLKRIDDGEDYWDSDKLKIEITHGYSRDNHPQDRQVCHSMIMIRPDQSSLALPVFQHPTTGSTNDVKSFAYDAEHSLPKIQEYLPNLKYFVGDCAAASFLTAFFCQLVGISLITRLPDNLSVVRTAFDNAYDGKIEWRSFEITPATDTEPAVMVQLAEVGDYSFTNRNGVEHNGEICPSVDGKMILVRAEAMREQKTATIKRRAEQERNKLLTKLAGIATACKPDVTKAVDKLKSSAKYCIIDDKYTTKKRAKYAKRGRPRKGVKPAATEYYVSGYKVYLDMDAINKAIEQELMYMLWCEDKSLEPQKVYLYYHQQANVEGGWRSLKDQRFFVDSFYVRSSKRIAGLCTALSLALLAQRLVLNDIRAYLALSNMAVPRASHNRPTQSPAWGTVCDAFTATDISFNFDTQSVDAAITDGFAVGFIMQAEPEIQKLFSADHLSRYAEAIQSGYAKFIAKQKALTRGKPVVWISDIHKPDLREVTKNHG